MRSVGRGQRVQVSARWLFPLVVLAVVVLNAAIFVDFELLDTGFERHPNYYRLELREPNGVPASDLPWHFGPHLHFDGTFFQDRHSAAKHA